MLRAKNRVGFRSEAVKTPLEFTLREGTFLARSHGIATADPASVER
jgi:hypothetical protein